MTEPPPQRRDRAIARWAITELMNAGYQCNEDMPTFCQTQDDAWIVRVAIRVENDIDYIFFDSFATANPWNGCGPLNQQLQTLRNASTQFYADCADSTQRIRLNTSLAYREDLNLPAWLQQHRESRYQAQQQLPQLTPVVPSKH